MWAKNIVLKDQIEDIARSVKKAVRQKANVVYKFLSCKIFDWVEKKSSASAPFFIPWGLSHSLQDKHGVSDRFHFDTRTRIGHSLDSIWTERR